ncbi:hypothetical protein SFRURICE_012278 [Spodoptera frugiperda]|nr:hypothetical protein SFRURICE_012278 [Spodoptera frugiperda]
MVASFINLTLRRYRHTAFLNHYIIRRYLIVCIIQCSTSSVKTIKMFKSIIVLACMLVAAIADPKPGVLYSAAYTAPVAAAYTAPVVSAAYTAPLAYSAYTAPLAASSSLA